MSIAALDKIAPDYQMLFSLPFREGSGLITHDVAKPQHRDVILVGAPTWTNVPSRLAVLSFNGTNNYLYCPAANCADLDFISGDYSILCWVNHNVKVQSKMVVGRYGVDLDGWELYLFDSGLNHYLTLRHHHASLAPDNRDGCYSDGWVNGEWQLIGISRCGLYPRHFRNGCEVEVTYEAGGLKDPDTCNRDLVVGCRYTKNADWYDGLKWGLRVCGRELSPEDHRFFWNSERHWFGV